MADEVPKQLAKHVFKPGESGNRDGRPKMPPDILKAKNLNRIEFQRLLNEHLQLDREEMKERLDNPATTMLELAVGNIVNIAAKQGDQMKLAFIVEHLIGKVREQVEVSNTYHHLNTIELIQLGEQAIKTLKGEIKE